MARHTSDTDDDEGASSAEEDSDVDDVSDDDKDPKMVVRQAQELQRKRCGIRQRGASAHTATAHVCRRGQLYRHRCSAKPR